MASMTEILILHGHLPIEYLDSGGNDESIAQDLIARGAITPAQLARARAAQVGAPFLELVDHPVDRTAVALVSGAICKRHGVLPIGFAGDSLILAMSDPGDVFAIDDVRAAAHMPVVPAVAEPDDLAAAIDRYIRADEELNDLSSTLEDETAGDDGSQAGLNDETTEDEAPIVRFVNLIVSQAIQDRASDIHLEPGEHSLRVRYRIDGVLHEMQNAPRSVQNGVISRLKIMSDIDIAERRKPQDGRMSIVHGGRQVDLRVATLPTVWGEKVVMRILDNTNTSMTLRDLNLLERNFQTFQNAYSKPYGMILVTGPTGSGKSTTLYTTLNAVSRPEINVITVEDPVEYRMAGVNQVQVNPKAGLTFASALRSILRSDPDVVLLGEIRDHETAQIAIEASLTGHLVLSTLHTNDAPSAVTRLTEMNIEPFLVGSALDCVVAQRLARRLCERCKAPITYERDALQAMRIPLDLDSELPQLFGPTGCTACSNTGYRGRLALHEVMAVTEEIERLTVARASSADIARVAREQGMLTLREDGWQKAALGITSVDEILRVVA
ncbi:MULTISPECIES: ATPase, T2SS/T4P/T4SS family [unclassified Leifsonia]|uniref:GspE/PulE family protein n=1 Tax=unclassified Leifsonia TaxID=2663824 RepID=UPI0008A7BB45|nr:MULTISPECIES: ATPase, T2SS/T4P/T4SS family [unclassified Leifsonia]SEH68052.1 type IV pilus assembly protein PilB [Leifsonia sp. CL154]SFL29564.1 type IV pilus assembly protein PilB [Leifsonia sp. CL147]